MTIIEAMRTRHSVRRFLPLALPQDKIEKLKAFVAQLNAESGLRIQVVTDEPKAMTQGRAHYGKFSGAVNYLALVGEKGRGLDERIGYYGEKAVLYMQQQGLNSCWVGLTYKCVPSAVDIGGGNRLRAVIPFGFGATQGQPHRSKPLLGVTKGAKPYPEWFVRGAECALLAPTAMNQQRFCLVLEGGNTVRLKAGLGFFTRMDAGIVRLHFELGAGKDNFSWA